MSFLFEGHGAHQDRNGLTPPLPAQRSPDQRRPACTQARGETTTGRKTRPEESGDQRSGGETRRKASDKGSSQARSQKGTQGGGYSRGADGSAAARRETRTGIVNDRSRQSATAEGRRPAARRAAHRSDRMSVAEGRSVSVRGYQVGCR